MCGRLLRIYRKVVSPMPKHDVLLEVKDLKKYFDIPNGLLRSKPLKAVDGLSLKIIKGETLGLVGESGCGKSTAGRTILHLYQPTVGQILFHGEPVHLSAQMRQYRKKTAMVFQDPYSSLNPRMTVADIIAEPLDIHGLYASKAERREKILSLMNKVGLNSEHANRYAHEFSGGQRQRIGIARALSTEPEFVVCDEPVSALDVSIQAQVVNMFAKLQQQLHLTYLFIAHDLLVVRYVSDRIAVMYLGRLVELAKADDICENPLHPYTKCLISAVPIPDPVIARRNQRVMLSGDIPSPLDTPTGCPFRTRCPYAREICEEAIPQLRELSTEHFVACHRAEEVN